MDDRLEYILGTLDISRHPYIVHNSNIDDLVKHKPLTRQLATANRARTVRIDLMPRQIKINMQIIAADRTAADSALSSLKRVLNRRKADLVVGRPGNYKVWNVHVSPRGLPTKRKGTDISRIPFTLNLAADDGVGRALNPKNLFSPLTGQTADFEVAVDYEGDEIALPIFVITYNSIAPTNSEIEVRLYNTSISTPTIISRTITPGSVLEVDCDAEIARLGTTIVRHRNDFISFAEAGEIFRYSDNATSRNIDISATYHPRFG